MTSEEALEIVEQILPPGTLTTKAIASSQKGDRSCNFGLEAQKTTLNLRRNFS